MNFNTIKAALSSKYILWAILAIPGIMIILHWALLSYQKSGNIGPALVHLAPVAILEIYSSLEAK